MSKESATSAPPSAASEKADRPFIALVLVFIGVFAAAMSGQVLSEHDHREDNLLAAQSSRAALIAERVNANLAVAVGASAGVAELARTSGIDAFRVARAASHAPPAETGAVVRDGAIQAITDQTDGNIAAAAAQAAGSDALWIGAPDMGEAATAPVIVRRVGDGSVVSVIDAERLLPELANGARVLIMSPGGAAIYASPALRDAGLHSQQQMARVSGARGAHAFLSDGRGGHWVAAASHVELGDFVVVAAQQAPAPLALWASALLGFALVAAAPMAALGVLYLLMRQNRQRAHFAEAEAERAETHFRIAADGAKAGVLEWRPSSDEVEISEQSARLLGAPRDVLKLHELLALVAGEDRFSVEEEFNRGRESGVLDTRFRVQRASGGYASIEIRGAAVEDSRGRGETRLFATVIDVTERQEAEALASRLERQLRSAIENFSGPFALWDTRRRLLLWNQSFARAFALGPDILRQRASYEAISAAAAPAIRRERHEPADPEVRIVELASGEWLHIVERRASDGGVITVGVDITSLKKKEEELARNERRLSDALARAESQEYRIKALAREAHEERQKAEEASRAKSTFLANMSHELRTPLNAVIGFSEIMAKELFGPIGNEQYKQYAGDIFDSGNHLLELINDILDMAKIEAGKLTLSPRPLDPSVAIEQAVRLTKRKAEEKGLSVVVDAENLTEIEADHRAVKQILLNLLSNAVKFTDKGAVMVHARGTPNGLTLRVVDTGCGIPPEHLPRLARPFEQVEQELTRNNSGTGLGLALTKSLAEMHGGKLSIQSEVGRGTIVTVALPINFGGRREPAAAA